MAQTQAPAVRKVDPREINAQQRNAVLGTAVEMKQQIFSQAIDTTVQNGAINVPVRNVGLIKRFEVIVSGKIRNAHVANAATVSPFGFQNVLSNIQFTDLNNNLRINTTGWHIANLNTAKARWPYAAALQMTAYEAGAAPVVLSETGQYGNNFPVVVSPLTIPFGQAAGAGSPFRMVYDIPLAYSDDDLRGAVYANVVNAVMQLGLTINPAATAFVGAAPADNTSAITSDGTCTYDGAVTVTVYQVYLDQIPTQKGVPILPILDLSTVYELKNTKFTGMTAGADFPVAYANFRDFLSTFAVYNSTGASTGLLGGGDVNTWALQSANFTNIWKVDPLTAAKASRLTIGLDFPVGCYYFSHRRKPLSTTQYGNMELVLNPAAATAGSAYLLIGWEDFALVNTLTQAGSLAAA